MVGTKPVGNIRIRFPACRPGTESKPAEVSVSSAELTHIRDGWVEVGGDGGHSTEMLGCSTGRRTGWP